MATWLQADDKFDHLVDPYGRVLPKSAELAAAKAQEVAQKILLKKTSFGSGSGGGHRRQQEDQLSFLPKFDLDELTQGKCLGCGGFSNVYEILKIQLHDDDGNDDADDDDDAEKLIEEKKQNKNNNENRRRSTKFSIKSSRNFLAKHCLRESEEDGIGGDARYAMKYLREESMANPQKFQHGAMDLATETHFLSSMEHPNIIKIRAVAKVGLGGFALGTEGCYFLVLDRLYDTLEYRMTLWREEMYTTTDNQSHEPTTSSSSSLGRFLQRKRKQRKRTTYQKDNEIFYLERLRIAFDIAGALQYLHSHRIMYRDLKPENLGFDIRGDIKLFDFGLAKQLPPLNESEPTSITTTTTTINDADNNSNNNNNNMISETYEMSGGCGTIRYMAPEVAQCRPYNLSVDVYSFAIVLWELHTLQKAFEDCSHGKKKQQQQKQQQQRKNKNKAKESKYDVHYRKVICGGQRPTLSNDIIPSKSIRKLLATSWSSNIHDRPDMNAIYNILKEEILQRNGFGDDIGHSRRRSTFVFFNGQNNTK